MIDKVQKIREKVERLKSQLLRGACSSQIAMETMCKEEAYDEVLTLLDTIQQEPVSGLDNGDMPIERWKQAVKAASNQRNYRSSKGLTETRDDYFVDGVQWADEHPKEEPASDDLEEAAKQFATDTETGKVDIVKQSSFFWGAIYHKQQMMAKAVDVTIAIPCQNLDGSYTQLVDSKEALPFGDKLKVLVIKEGRI